MCSASLWRPESIIARADVHRSLSAQPVRPRELAYPIQSTRLQWVLSGRHKSTLNNLNPAKISSFADKVESKTRVRSDEAEVRAREGALPGTEEERYPTICNWSLGELVPVAQEAQEVAANSGVVSLDSATASRQTVVGQGPNLRKHQSRYANRKITHAAAQRPLIRHFLSRKPTAMG
jgi:hypothetical protein